MYTESFTAPFEQFQPLTAPIAKANKLAVAQLEKLLDFQLAALHSYTDLGIRPLKTFAAIESAQDFQDFLNSQVELAGALPQKLLDDLQTLMDLGAGFKAEFDKLSEENISEFAGTTAPSMENADKAA